MKQYQDMLRHILAKGTKKTDRTGVGTISTFGYQARFDLSEGFPLVTTKKLFTKAIIHELLWLISGSTNIKYLKDNGVTIWDEWADADGELGPVYGKQWRHWSATQVLTNDFNHQKIERKSIDQLKEVVERIKVKPDCRRLIVTAWNPADVPKMKLPPCHMFFQFNTTPLTIEERRKLVRDEDLMSDDYPVVVARERLSEDSLLQLGIPKFKLHCQMYQRSADTFLGVPFNIASYALLTHMVAQVTNCVPGEFIHTFGDLHLYLNHLDQVEELLAREPKPLPKLILNADVKSLFDFKYEDVKIDGYDPWPAIKAPVAV